VPPRQPLILTVEDLHWADPTSEEVLTALVERMSGARILFLATYRPGYPLPWAGKSFVTQLALLPLSDEDSLGVVHSALQTAEVPAPIIRHLLAKAEGNPLFMEELVQALVDQGVFVRGPAGAAARAEFSFERSIAEF
jgi:predicted ATPase